MTPAAPLACTDRFCAFQSHQLDELEQVLRDDSAASDLQPIEHAGHLLLNASTLRTQDERLAYTQSALMAVCGKLAPGLGQLVLDLAGLRPQIVEQSVQTQAAVEIFNRVVQLRMNALEGYSLVLDRDCDRILGIVGPGYRALAGIDLLTAAQSAAEDNRLDFCRATLHGRDLAVLFRDRDDRQFGPRGLACALYCAGGDAGGQGVRAAPALVDSSAAFALGRAASRRVVHAGRDVRRRAADLLRRAAASVRFPLKHLTLWLDQASAQRWSLPLGRGAQRRAALDTLSVNLAAMTPDTPLRLVRQAVLSRYLRNDVLNVSRLDLVESLMDETLCRAPSAAEAAARAAWAFLRGSSSDEGARHEYQD